MATLLTSRRPFERCFWILPICRKKVNLSLYPVQIEHRCIRKKPFQEAGRYMLLMPSKWQKQFTLFLARRGMSMFMWYVNLSTCLKNQNCLETSQASSAINPVYRYTWHLINLIESQKKYCTESNARRLLLILLADLMIKYSCFDLKSAHFMQDYLQINAIMSEFQ